MSMSGKRSPLALERTFNWLKVSVSPLSLERTFNRLKVICFTLCKLIASCDLFIFPIYSLYLPKLLLCTEGVSLYQKLHVG
jgi:hypothetical protein